MQYETVAIPEGLRYTKNHLWAEINEGLCTLGWTDYIQNSAGDVNHIDLPEKGKPVEPDEDFGSIETSKWVDRLYSPVRGTVVEVNEKLVQHPEIINHAPFTEGWFVRISLQGEIDTDRLLSPGDYLELIKTCGE